MRKTKLERVMELVINNKSREAEALLHEVFIEKARAIHESMMSDEMDESEDGRSFSVLLCIIRLFVLYVI